MENKEIDSLPRAASSFPKKPNLIISLLLLYRISRPIAGHANLCPSSISTKRQELDILLSTVKHEMLHALGFSVSLFAFYRDKEGRPLTPRGENGKPNLNEE